MAISSAGRGVWARARRITASCCWSRSPSARCGSRSATASKPISPTPCRARSSATQITPRFRDGDYPGGINAGADAIITQLQAPPEAAEQRAVEPPSRSEQSARLGGQRRLARSADLLGRDAAVRLPACCWARACSAGVTAGAAESRSGGLDAPSPRRGQRRGLVRRRHGARRPHARRARRRRELGRRWRRQLGRRRLFRRRRLVRRRRSVGRMVMQRLSEEDHALVTAAVAKAERESDGEIVTIVAQRSDAYHDVALHYAVLAMLLVPALGAVAAAELDRLGDRPRPRLERRIELSNADGADLFVKMTVLFLIVRYALAWMPLRMALTPGRTKSRRVHRRAVELFRRGCELKTRGRTGVLLYLEPRRAPRRDRRRQGDRRPGRARGVGRGDGGSGRRGEGRPARPGHGARGREDRRGACADPAADPRQSRTSFQTG